jgi:hypothetical protein
MLSSANGVHELFVVAFLVGLLTVRKERQNICIFWICSMKTLLSQGSGIIATQSNPLLHPIGLQALYVGFVPA